MPGPSRGISRSSKLLENPLDAQNRPTRARLPRPTIAVEAPLTEWRTEQASQRRFGKGAPAEGQTVAGLSYFSKRPPASGPIPSEGRISGLWRATVAGIQALFKPAAEVFHNLYARWKEGLPGGPFLLMGGTFLLTESPSLSKPHPEDIVRPLPKEGEADLVIPVVLEASPDSKDLATWEIRVSQEKVFGDKLGSHVRFTSKHPINAASKTINVHQKLEGYSGWMLASNGSAPTFLHIGETMVVGALPQNPNRHNFDPKKTKIFRIEGRPDALGVRQWVLVEFAPQGIERTSMQGVEHILTQFVAGKLQVDPNLMRREFGDWFQKWASIFEAGGWKPGQVVDLLKLGLEEAGKDSSGRPSLPDLMAWLGKRMALLEDMVGESPWPANASFHLVMTKDLPLPDFDLIFGPISELHKLGYSHEEIAEFVRVRSRIDERWWSSHRTLQDYIELLQDPRDAMQIFIDLGKDAERLPVRRFLECGWSWEIHDLYTRISRLRFKKTSPLSLMYEMAEIVERLDEAKVSVETQVELLKAIVSVQTRPDQLYRDLNTLRKSLKSGLLELFPAEIMVSAMIESLNASPKKPKP